MQLVRDRDVSASRRDVVFRPSPWAAWLAFIVLTGVAGGLVTIALLPRLDAHTYRGLPSWLFWLASGVLTLCAGSALQAVRATRRPSSWLVRLCENSMMVRFRSHLNFHFPEDDPVAVLLTPGEIEWVRKVTEEQLRWFDNREQNFTVRHIDFKLRGSDFTPLARALKEEIAREAPLVRRTRTKALHYPAILLDGNILRVAWGGISPGIAVALDTFAKRFTVRPDEHISAKRSSTLSEAELDARIVSLATRGELSYAAHLIRQARGVGLGEATKMAEAIRDAGKTSSPVRGRGMTHP